LRAENTVLREVLPALEGKGGVMARTIAELEKKLGRNS